MTNDGVPADHSFKIRTVTAFVGLTPEKWQDDAVVQIVFRKASTFLRTARSALAADGYEVQSIRIATNALASCSAPDEAAQLALRLDGLARGLGIGFLGLGATSDGTLPPVLPEIVRSTAVCSCSFAWQEGMHEGHAQELARCIFEVAEITKGEGNFRFGVSFGCPDGIPYFPAASAPPSGLAFAVGLENSALLHGACRLAADAAAEGLLPLLEAVELCTMQAFGEALAPVQALGRLLEAEQGWRFLGLDASFAPGLEGPSIADSFEVLGLGPFGGPGSLAFCERLTAALKRLPGPTCGYSGLMLPVCEDPGLAAAASRGVVTIQSLLAMSTVCGCGLDTVPVPGPADDTPPEERERLERAAAALLLDVAALSRRLRKPLAARLLPTPGGVAGATTAYDSPYLVDCAIMNL